MGDYAGAIFLRLINANVSCLLMLNRSVTSLLIRPFGLAGYEISDV